LLFIRLPLYHPDTQLDNTYRVVSLVAAIASITTGWFALGWIRVQPEGSWLILLLLLIVWAADTGAYFSGRAFGKRKLAPHISPGKTMAGLYGGLIAAPLIALLAVKLMPIEAIEPVRLVMLSLVTVLVSVGGDLMISLHKRTSGYKDSGNLLPGHGGILDRLDSLLAAAPFFALGLLFSGV
jgi:phosphatidate cytidylyltransferase